MALNPWVVRNQWQFWIMVPLFTFDQFTSWLTEGLRAPVGSMDWFFFGFPCRFSLHFWDRCLSYQPETHETQLEGMNIAKNKTIDLSGQGLPKHMGSKIIVFVLPWLQTLVVREQWTLLLFGLKQWFKKTHQTGWLMDQFYKWKWWRSLDFQVAKLSHEQPTNLWGGLVSSWFSTLGRCHFGGSMLDPDAPSMVYIYLHGPIPGAPPSLCAVLIGACRHLHATPNWSAGLQKKRLLVYI